MKLDKPKQVNIGENTFYIWPLGAMDAAELSGDVIALIAPLAATLAPLAGKADTEDEGSVMDITLDAAAPAISQAFQALSGKKLRELLTKLLLTGKVTVETDKEGDAVRLTKDIADDLFCCAVDEMYRLAFEVMKVNYGGFFTKLAGPSGGLGKLLMTKTIELKNTAG
jgi:hypothetical protein